MKETRVAKRFAQAFIDLAQQNNFLEEAYRDMVQLGDACKHIRELRNLVNNPQINPSKKKIIFAKIFSSRFHPTSMVFLDIIIHKRREIYLEHICSDFIEKYRVIKGITRAIVVSASGVDDIIRKQVLELIGQSTKTEVALEEEINPEIIGGFILRFNDVQYDTTIARSLNMYRSQFNKNLYVSKILKK